MTLPQSDKDKGLDRNRHVKCPKWGVQHLEKATAVAVQKTVFLQNTKYTYIKATLVIINSRAVSDVIRSWINHFCWHSAKCKLRHTESFHSKFWFHLNTHSSSPAGLLLLGSPQPQLVYSGTSPLSDQTNLPFKQLFYLISQDKTIYLLLKCHSIQSSRCSSDQETCQCTSLPLQWKTLLAGRHWPGKTTIMHDIFTMVLH